MYINTSKDAAVLTLNNKQQYELWRMRERLVSVYVCRRISMKSLRWYYDKYAGWRGAMLGLDITANSVELRVMIMQITKLNK